LLKGACKKINFEIQPAPKPAVLFEQFRIFTVYLIGDYKPKKIKTMTKLNAIGLDVEKSKDLADMLNDLLANFSIYYMNVRGFHWNIKGEKFFELHLKFEEIYTDLQEKIDEIAERILTLGQTPVHAYSDYNDQSQIKEVKNVSNGREGVESLLNGFQILITKERKILDLAGELNDEGTNALMSDYIREQEKTVWMLSSYLKK
jgi:starvation-inducible DNA-binding protein